ncbi:MAG TPA: histidine phosphatase family protein [Bacteroidales bacterium]|nr:histidine phosphatase family protein [Bacteroidales bacterium]
MTEIVLIRHASTDHIGKILTGRQPGISINKEGTEQALTLSHRLARKKLSAIYCSPLDRAIQTAEYIAKSKGINLITSNDFNELDFGIWTGMKIDDLNNDPVFKRFNLFRSITRIPGGELILEAQYRIVNGILKVCLGYPETNIAIVSHSDMIKIAVTYFAGMHIDMMQRLEISPASVSIINLDVEYTRIILLNSPDGIL